MGLSRTLGSYRPKLIEECMQGAHSQLPNLAQTSLPTTTQFRLVVYTHSAALSPMQGVPDPSRNPCYARRTASRRMSSGSAGLATKSSPPGSGLSTPRSCQSGFTQGYVRHANSDQAFESCTSTHSR